MLVKTINVSGQIVSAGGITININFNYRQNISELKQIDFNFNVNEINVYGSFNVSSGNVMNYSVNNGILEKSVIEDVQARLVVLAENPEVENLYQTEI